MSHPYSLDITMNTNTNEEEVTFYMQGWEPEGTSKAIVCLIHGIGEHTGRYAHVGKALNEAGYALYGFDLRGHGQTPGPRGYIPSFDVVMQDIHQFIEFQKQEHPGLPVFLYGHSLGGILVLAYVIQHGDGLNGVIASAPGMHNAIQEQKLKLILVKLLGTLVPKLTLASGLDVNGLSRDPKVAEAYTHDPLVHDRMSVALGVIGLAAIDVCFAGAKEFKSPLLIVHGTADWLAYTSGSEKFLKLAGEMNKDITLKLWDGMYHELHNEPEQAEVFKVMIEWLDKHL